MNQPTREYYEQLQNAYSFFKVRLFNNILPECLITMQRKARSFGYFCGGRFANQNKMRIDEIALNPKYIGSRSEPAVLSTLTHEMAHLWQHHFGESGRRGYHNRQWANKMIKIGLYPSDTGQPGGRETGDSMTHYIMDDGRFRYVCQELLDSGFRFVCTDADAQTRRAVVSKATKGNDSSNRWKYTCPGCNTNVWGKPKIQVLCGGCASRFPMLSTRS